MTDAQLAKARGLARAGVTQLEFVEGLIEAPPVAAGKVDVVISNGVINLAPDKDAVFRAAAAALRPGGRMALADIVSERELIERTRSNVALWAACIAGAVPLERLPRRDRARRSARRDRAGERVPLHRPSGRAQRRDKYGVASVTVLATKRRG